MASATAKPMSHGRRLFELLEEQQEPFLLNVYLLEHGYSDRTIKANAGTAFLCWPASLRRFGGAYGFKRKRGGFLRCLLRKVVYNKVLRKARRWERAAAIGGGDRGGASTGNGIRWRSIFEIKGKNAAVDFHRLSYSAATDEGELSPVSVLKPHSDEAEEEAPSTSNFDSPPNEANESSWVCFRHAHAPKLINRKRQHSYRLVEEQGMEEDVEEEEEMELPPRENQIDAQADISHLIDFDLSKSSKEWTKFRHEIAEVGAEIERIIFEESLLDLVVDCQVLFTLIK